MQEMQIGGHRDCKYPASEASFQPGPETSFCNLLAVDLPDIMTPKDAAQVLPFSLNTIRELCASGELPARKVGRRWLIPRALLIGYLCNTSSETTNASHK